MSTSFDGTLHGISSEYARVMAESLPHLVWVSRPDGEMEYLNRRCLEYFKLPMAELLGWDWARVVHPDDVPSTMERWTEALRSGGEHSVELRLRRHDGAYRWHLGRALPLQVADRAGRRWFGTCTDIDDQKRAEQSLAALNVALENAVEGISRLDVEGRYVSVNPAYARIAGYAAEEMIGMPWQVTVHAEDRDAMVAAYRQMRQTGRSEAEVRGLRKGGATFYKRVVLVRCDGPHREFTGHYCFMGDITEKREAEVALRASETRFRAMIENSFDAVQLLGADGTILYASPAIVRVGGRTAEEVIGHKAFEWSYPDDLADFGEQFGKFLATRGAAQRVESRYLHKDGSQRWVEATCTNLLDDPAVGAVVVNVHDITDRKRAEEDREKFVALVENAADFIGIATLDGRVLYLNPAGRRLVGLEEGRSVSETRVEDYVPADVVELWDKVALPQALAGGRWEGEVRFQHFQTGRLLDIQQCLFVVKAPGTDEPLCLATVACDITERKRLEEQLRQSQKMEAVGRLAGGVAHDFNNLLTVINGYSEFILASLESNSPFRAMMEDVQKAGERAAGLTRQLLAFSRQQMLCPKVLDLNQVVAELCKMLRRVIGEDVELVLKPGAGLLKVEADPGQIEQVLMNLAVNSRDAMPTGGRLTIETHNETSGEKLSRPGAERRSSAFVVLSVSDTGIGMTPEVRSHIFEPFFTTKGHGSGTGLGLATVYGIVKQSGGHIEVDTAVGHGTTFRVYLPAICSNSANEENASGEQALPSGSETVLLVEDEEAVRSLTGLMLQQLGYTVLAAASAEQAIGLCQKSDRLVDLLLTDVVMPGKSGRMLAEQLQAENPQLCVLYMSGYTDDAVVRHGVKQDRAAFIQKPFTAVELARKLREVLDVA